MRKNRKRAAGYVIGVDGGGAKTFAVLADLKGKILAKAKTGSSHPRNIGLKKAIDNVVLVVSQLLKKIAKNKKILATFLGLAAIEEEFKFRKVLIKKELLKHKEISPIFKGKVIIGSDQLIGFRSGTQKKDGLVVISGFGCAVHGWKGKKEVKINGWGYLTEQGSAFFVGQKGLEAIFEDLDGRGQKTLMTKLIFQKLKVKNKEGLIRKIYSKNPTEIVPPLAISVNAAAQRGDKIAKNILIGVGRELAFSANTAIKKLRLTRKKFPLVLIGSMFKSKIILDSVKKEVRKFAPDVEFIRPKAEPAVGAVKLAIEMLTNGNN